LWCFPCWKAQSCFGYSVTCGAPCHPAHGSQTGRKPARKGGFLILAPPPVRVLGCLATSSPWQFGPRSPAGLCVPHWLAPAASLPGVETRPPPLLAPSHAQGTAPFSISLRYPRKPITRKRCAP
jgi:hypothetical protein